MSCWQDLNSQTLSAADQTHRQTATSSATPPSLLGTRVTRRLRLESLCREC